MSQVVSTQIIVPCFNEEHRLDSIAFRDFVQENPHTGFVFVNDGSTDQTDRLLSDLCQSNSQLTYVTLNENQGKGAAIRRGVLHAYDLHPVYIGYWDADLATPLNEIENLKELLVSPTDYWIAFGSRVKLLGRDITRKRYRHYSGRFFATLASCVVKESVYDTQCGAKLFIANQELKSCFEQSFVSRWLFDIEIMLRLSRRLGGSAGYRMVEVPLHTWREIGDSRIKPVDVVVAAVDLFRIYVHDRFSKRHVS